MGTQQYVTFIINDHLFGINVLLVREINPSTDITPVDLAPDFIRGLLNLRGQIVTVIDPAVRLGMGEREITERSRCIVLKTEGELQKRENSATLADETVTDHVGLLVDVIGDMVSADENDIEPPPANIGDVDGKFIRGVFKMEGVLMVVLKTRDILSSEIKV
jgi:purine-binding chemotaxis protein CheW